MNNEYPISSIIDFLNVPEDRLAVCLSEFAEFLEVARGVKDVSDAIGKEMGVEVLKDFTFVWIDDGKRSKEVRISVSAKAWNSQAEGSPAK